MIVVKIDAHQGNKRRLKFVNGYMFVNVYTVPALVLLIKKGGFSNVETISAEFFFT